MCYTISAISIKRNGTLTTKEMYLQSKRLFALLKTVQLVQMLQIAWEKMITAGFSESQSRGDGTASPACGRTGMSPESGRPREQKCGAGRREQDGLETSGQIPCSARTPARSNIWRWAGTIRADTGVCPYKNDRWIQKAGLETTIRPTVCKRIHVGKRPAFSLP
jgi:hypothetical protein